VLAKQRKEERNYRAWRNRDGQEMEATQLIRVQ
jgi:hypothetical protein